MTLLDHPPTIDCVQQRIKRKLEDYVDDDLSPSDLLPVRMRKDDSPSSTSFPDQITPHPSHFQPRASSSSTQNPTLSSFPNRIQFFVRTISDGKTLVLHGNPHDKIKFIHEKIQSATGIPVIEQRLIYRGKQLQWEDSLLQCRITNDAGLHLVGRMRSTGHPQVWQVIDDLISVVCRMCKGERGVSLKSIKTRLMDFLNMMPKDGIDHAAPYLNIFLSSSAPAALVMLYMSPHTGNKECALESIQHFIKSSRNLLPIPIYSEFAPVVLEFCKLLGRAATHNDPLYELCRSSLGSMVEYVKLGRNSKSYDGGSYKKVVIAVQEIFPFVDELANKLSDGLASSMESVEERGPSSSDVHDFTAFVRPLRNAIIDQVAFGTPIPVQYNHNPWYSHEINFLYKHFLDLLAKIQGCLNKVKEYINVRKEKGDGGWDQYLYILKELLNIAQLYQGAEESFWANLRQNKTSLCYLIVRYAKRGEDYKWILEHKDLTDFESRRHLVMMLLPEVKDEYEELQEMLIDRSQLLAESFEYISGAAPDTLRGGLFMEFKNEEATGPGVLREWFFLVCQAIFNPQNALFVVCPNDRRRFFPNPASKVDPMHLEYFRFAGRVIALALVHRMQVGIVFDRAFFLQLGGVDDVCLEDIKDADPYLYSSCKQILDMDACAVDEDALGLTFVWEVEELGSIKVLELLPDGKHISVNSRNRKEYVDLLIKHRFVTSIAQQVTHFAQGFADVVTNQEIQKLCFRSLELQDLDGMLHGSETPISLDDWKAHTDYNGYKDTDPQIHWFWKIVGEMTAEQRNVLLFFWTSVKYLPVEGFCGLASRLYIYKSNETFDRLPSSHTCFYRICFPAYPSMAIMQQRLNLITQEHVGCSFGTW